MRESEYCAIRFLGNGPHAWRSVGAGGGGLDLEYVLSTPVLLTDLNVHGMDLDNLSRGWGTFHRANQWRVAFGSVPSIVKTTSQLCWRRRIRLIYTIFTPIGRKKPDISRPDDTHPRKIGPVRSSEASDRICHVGVSAGFVLNGLTPLLGGET